MKHLKFLSLPLILMSALAVPVFAGETPSPPCVPGEVSSPPCTSQPQTENLTEPGETGTSPASDSVGIVDLSEAVGWALSLF